METSWAYDSTRLLVEAYDSSYYGSSNSNSTSVLDTFAKMTKRQKDANIAQAVLFGVVVLVWVYYGWIKNHDEAGDRSVYFEGAMDAIDIAREGKKKNKKKQIDAAAQREKEKEEEEPVKRASLTAVQQGMKRKSLLAEQDSDIPRPSENFRTSLNEKKRRESLRASNIDFEVTNEITRASVSELPAVPENTGAAREIDVEAGAPSRNSDFQQEARMTQVEEGKRVRDMLPPQYTKESHYFYDIVAAKEEISTWPHPYHRSHAVEMDDALLIDAIRGEDSITFTGTRKHLIPDVKRLTQYGYSLAHEACAVRSVDSRCDIHMQLLDTIDMKARTSHGTTLLMKAVVANDLYLAAYLIENGCDIDAQDIDGNTALMHGCISGNRRVARFMIPFGADPWILNIDGHRAVDLALLNGNARAATDILGPAAVIVPGYVANKTQNLQGAFTLGKIIVTYGLTLTSYSFSISDYWENDRPRAEAMLSLLTIPSVYMAAMPYQSIAERVVTLLQMRLPYEAFVSLGQERTTVRLGGMEMVITVFSNAPQLVLSSFFLSSYLASDQDVPSWTVFTIIMASFASGEAFKGTYLTRYDLTEDPEADPKNFSGYALACTIYSGMSVVMRAMFWVIVFSLHGKWEVFFVSIYIILTRLRLTLMKVGNKDDLTMLDLSPIDIFALFLSDCPFSPNSQQWYFAEMLTFLENTCVIWSTAVQHRWSDNLILFAVGSFLKEASFISLVHSRIHKSQFQTVDIAFLKIYFSPSFVFEIKDFFVHKCSGIIDSTKETFNYYARAFSYQCKWWDAYLTEKNACVGCCVAKGDKAKNEERKQFLAQHRMRQNSAASLASLHSYEKLPDGTVRMKAQGEYIKEGTYAQFKLDRLKCMDLPPLYFLFIQLFLAVTIVWADDTDQASKCSANNSLCGTSSNDDDYNNNSYYIYDDQQTKPCCTHWQNFAIFATKPLLVIFYLVSVVEAITCSIGQAMKRTYPGEKCYDLYLNAIGGMQPVLQWYSESYHYETHTDSNGKSHQTRVVTHTATGYYEYDDCLDVSDHYQYDGKPFVHIAIENNYTFADQYTSDDYDRVREKFYRDNDKDTHQNIRDSTFYGEVGCEEILPPMIACAQGALTFLRFTFYVYASILSLSFFYRWFVNSITSDMELKMSKRVLKRSVPKDEDVIFERRLEFFCSSAATTPRDIRILNAIPNVNLPKAFLTDSVTASDNTAAEAEKSETDATDATTTATASEEEVDEIPPG